MIYWDLHGVLADLSKAVFGFEPPHWDYKVSGENLLDIVETNLSLLEKCEQTEYTNLVKSLPFLFVISSQPVHWRSYSDEWLKKNFNPKKTFRQYVNKPQEKLALLKPQDRIVEDYPFFEDYSQVILIDKPYNQNAPAKIRVHSPEELREYVCNC